MSGGTRPPFLLGTAFIYYGGIIDANNPAEGTYNVMFVLWDSPERPNELGIIGIQNFEASAGVCWAIMLSEYLWLRDWQVV